MPDPSFIAKLGNPQIDVSATATRQSQSKPAFITTSTTIFTRPILYTKYNMADPKKQEKDYSKEVDSILPEARSLAQVGTVISPT